jgi:hypothetical protein
LQLFEFIHGLKNRFPIQPPRFFAIVANQAVPERSNHMKPPIPVASRFFPQPPRSFRFAFCVRMLSDDKYLLCPLCGQSHSVPFLKSGQRALCVQCGTVMAERGRLGPDAALVFAFTGLVLAIPSLLLPFVTL